MPRGFGEAGPPSFHYGEAGELRVAGEEGVTCYAPTKRVDGMDGMDMVDAEKLGSSRLKRISEIRFEISEEEGRNATWKVTLP